MAGLGWIRAPRPRDLQGPIDSRQLVPVLGDGSGGALALLLMYPRHRHLSARLRVFVDWVAALYARTFAGLLRA